MEYFNSEDDFVQTSITTRTFYDKDGLEIADEKKSVAQVLHQKNRRDKQQLRKYFIFTVNGSIYDPQGVDGNKKKNMTFLLKQVDQAIFDFYMLYLTTKNSIYFTRAQRGLINDR